MMPSVVAIALPGLVEKDTASFWVKGVLVDIALHYVCYKEFCFETPLQSTIPEHGHLPLKQLFTNSVNRTDNWMHPTKGILQERVAFKCCIVKCKPW